MFTKTINQLHFEDLDPIRFEELILSIVYRMKEWYKLDHFGKMGTDGGIDIRAIEEGSNGNITYFFQCKRYLKITNTMLKNIVDDYLLKNEYVPNYYVLVVSCSLTRKQIDFFEKYCEENNFQKVIIWTKSILEVKLYAEYPDLLYTYFGVELNSLEENKKDIHNYSVNAKYFDGLISQVTHAMKKISVQQVPLKDFYIDIYLTKANDKGERIFSPSILADEVFDKLIISDESVFLILGEPGQGKSTLCLWMFYQEHILNKFGKPIYVFRLNNAISKICDENNPNLPIIENAIYFSNIINYEECDVAHGIKSRMKRLAESCDFLKESIIIFDGYDELYSHFPDNYTVSNFFDDIYEMANVLNSKIIVTSRITCFPSLSKLSLEVDKIYYIDYLHLEQQIEWVKNRYSNIDKFDYIVYNEEMLKIIHREDDYKNLCDLLNITLLFQMIVDCNILIDKKCNRANLYKILTINIIHKSYERNRKVRIKIENKINDDNVEKALCGLAYEIWRENDKHVTKKDDEYEKIILNCGILFFFKVTNMPNKTYHIEFLHRSFYQYYLALFLKKEFEKALERNNIVDFFKIISFRVVEFDVWHILEDMIDETCINVEDIIDIMCKTECITEEKDLLFPIKKGNNTFVNIISILNKYHVEWNKYFVNKLGNILRYYNCYGINLSYANLSNIDLSCCSFIGSNFYHTNFCNSNMRGTTFRGGNLQYADFTNAILSGADLRGTDMRNAVLYGANLRGADLRGADIRGIKKDSNTNLYGITVSQMPEGIYRQVTQTIHDSIKELGYDISEDVNIIDN